MSKQYVFVDVDGTLWNDKSVISFYRQFVESQSVGPIEAVWQEFLTEVRVLQDNGASREQLNQWFYRSRFCDVPVIQIERIAAIWWQRQKERDDFWFDNVVARMREHRERGHELVLVTGSFGEIVAPLQKQLGARHALVSSLVVHNACYTGELAGGPMIGEGKYAAVQAFMNEHGIDPELTHGYGDDDSDVPFLSLLKWPCAVTAPGSPMARIATERGWAQLVPRHAVRAQAGRQACPA